VALAVSWAWNIAEATISTNYPTAKVSLMLFMDKQTQAEMHQPTTDIILPNRKLTKLLKID